MSLRFLPSAVLALATLTLLGHSQAAPTAVDLRVEQDNTATETAKADRYTKTYRRALVVHVTNNSGDALDLKVKHIIFGRDTVNHDIVVIDQGEAPLAVKPHSTEQIETKSGVATAVTAHFDIAKKVKVPGSGATIVGHGVQIMQGDVLAAEDYEPASMKDEWGKAAPLTPKAGTPPPPAATPAKK